MVKFSLEHDGIFAVILVIVLILAVGAMSWGITCGIVYLICKCFGWEWFTLLRATGIWLALGLISSIAGTAQPR